MFDIYSGEPAFEIAVTYMLKQDVPEGVYILETPSNYIAVFNPDETMVKPSIVECWDTGEAGEILEEKWNAFKNFYPRPPRGGRPVWMGSAEMSTYFYPRPPRGGRRK